MTLLFEKSQKIKKAFSIICHFYAISMQFHQVFLHTEFKHKIFITLFKVEKSDFHLMKKPRSL